MWNFIISITIIISGLAFGYFIQFIEKKGKLKFPFEYNKLPGILQKIVLIFFNPFILAGALWIVKLDSIKLIALPFLGMAALLLGGFLSALFGEFQGLSRKQLGAFIIAGSFTNIGLIGGLICYLFFGELGYAFVPLYKLFEELVYFGIGFPLAKSYSAKATKKASFREGFDRIFNDLFIRVALISITIGLILNFTGMERPAFYAHINSIAIPLASFLLLTSIGLNLRFSKMKLHIKPSLMVVLIKMLIVPAVISLLGFGLGLGNINNGLPLKVVVVLSSMPTGFVALVPPAIYDLDVDLANTVWLLTTAALIVVIPWLTFITNLL